MANEGKEPGSWFGAKGYPVKGTLITSEHYSCTIKEMRENSYPIELLNSASVLGMTFGTIPWVAWNMYRRRPVSAGLHRFALILATGYYGGYYIKRGMQQFTMGKLKFALDYADKYGSKNGNIVPVSEPVTFGHPSVLNPWQPVR